MIDLVVHTCDTILKNSPVPSGCLHKQVGDCYVIHHSVLLGVLEVLVHCTSTSWVRVY